MGISVYYKPAVIIGDGGGDGGDASKFQKAFAETLAGTISSLGSDITAGISRIAIASIFASNSYLSYASFPDLINFASPVNPSTGTSRNATYAFYNCSNLLECHFPQLSFIMDNMFQSCSKLSIIEAPNVFGVSAGAFSGCSLLTSISFPLATQGSYAANCFYGCSKLQSVYMPYFCSIGCNFTGCSLLSEFRSFLIPQSSITNNMFYSTALSNIADIPAWSLAITIGDQAFGFTSVSELNFINCSSINGQSAMSSTLINVSLPIVETLVAYYHFASCSLLSQVYAPDCSTVGNYAFLNCKNLEKIELGLGRGGYIYTQAFSSCSKLSEIYMINYSTAICALNNQNAFSNTPMSNSTYLGHYGSIYVAPTLVNTYKAATNWAAYANRIAAAPESFLSKAVWPYQYYNSNTMTAIPSEKENVTAVHRLAFCNCQSLAAVSLSLCEYIGVQAFEQCYSISAVDLPQCKVIGKNAFQGCTRLLSANLPECLAINTNAFYNCQSLTTLNANKCEIIYSSAFGMCYSLSTVNLSKCKAIYSSAFASCRSLTSIDLPECLFVGGFAFAYCTTLESISLPKCVFLSESAFTSCGSLTSIDLPKVLNLFLYCFYSCSNLETAILPECLVVGQYCFASCSKLSSISIPKCRYISIAAFNNCSNLATISLPEVKVIDRAFVNCSKLSQVYLPSNKMVFLDNYSAFFSTPMSNSAYLGYFGSIYVPASLISQYQNDPVWSWYSSRFASISG